ncbi:MAG: SDR family oxidoreductase [Oscillochloris sp.]|nr:SDR family oxidoreductase [Oscillochloris sp.]
MSLSGKVALITGGSSGIGRAAALMLAAEGVRVGVVGRSADELEQVVNDITKHGGEALPLQADVAQPAEIERAANELGKRWNRIDILFANAGINGVWAPLDELEPAEWDKTLNINLRGTYLAVKYTLPFMKPHGGSIIITASVNGTRIFSNTGATAYAVSKAGQVAFTKMIALELARDRIRVNVICPGAIETNINQRTQQRDLEKIREPVEFPAGRIPLTDGEPPGADEVAKLVRFLASDESRHISGAEIFIDGTESLLQG